MGAGHSWPRGIATGRGEFSGQTVCSTEPAYQRGFSGATVDRSRRTPHVARAALSAQFGENVVPRRFGTFISTLFIATYAFEVLKISLSDPRHGRDWDRCFWSPFEAPRGIPGSKSA